MTRHFGGLLQNQSIVCRNFGLLHSIRWKNQRNLSDGLYNFAHTNHSFSTYVLVFSISRLFDNGEWYGGPSAEISTCVKGDRSSGLLLYIFKQYCYHICTYFRMLSPFHFSFPSSSRTMLPSSRRIKWISVFFCQFEAQPTVYAHVIVRSYQTARSWHTRWC